MRSFTPQPETWWKLERMRYMELKAFCKQYPRWLTELTGSAGISGMKYDGMPRSPQPGDPTERAVERRDMLNRKIRLVEGCASDVGDGSWYQALILNVCNGMSWELIRDLHPEALKNSMKIQFFHARRSFFRLLDERKE